MIEDIFIINRFLWLDLFYCTLVTVKIQYSSTFFVVIILVEVDQYLWMCKLNKAYCAFYLETYLENIYNLFLENIIAEKLKMN